MSEWKFTPEEEERVKVVYRPSGEAELVQVSYPSPTEEKPSVYPTKPVISEEDIKRWEEDARRIIQLVETGAKVGRESFERLKTEWDRIKESRAGIKAREMLGEKPSAREVFREAGIEVL